MNEIKLRKRESFVLKCALGMIEGEHQELFEKLKIFITPLDRAFLKNINRKLEVSYNDSFRKKLREGFEEQLFHKVFYGED